MIPPRQLSLTIEELKSLLQVNDPSFWNALAASSAQTQSFTDVFTLSNLRKKALKKGFENNFATKGRLKLAIIGGCSLYPLHELVEHFLYMHSIPCELFIGEYDNYISEILNSESKLYSFKPDVVFMIPSAQRCKYEGRLTDSLDQQRAQIESASSDILNLCSVLNAKAKCEIVLTNFIPNARHDLGSYKTRTLASDWNFKKSVNIELGITAPNYVHICDLEFMGYREGFFNAVDNRAWFETKQPASPDFLVKIAKEVAHLVSSFKKSAKKVLVLDLDNTLWGGVIGDDGVEGIHLGDTSAKGEAFKSFQKYIATLPDRGLLLAVCSKNEIANAMKPFEKHPEMALKIDQIVSFKANWNPKSENIKQIAEELNLGLDSFVFVDDNPAEIEIVRQFAPDVTTILLSDEPSDYTSILQDSRLFEIRNLTEEDAVRTEQYRQEAARKALSASMTDMKSYLESLEMKATITEFNELDTPRLSQLINKSNQFNLTTKRRTESEVAELINDNSHVAFSMRLSDRFGDHGLISIVIGKILKSEKTMVIDTWLMSCRVLERKVEQEVLNEVTRLAKLKGCEKIIGVYLPTAKNEMVRGFYPKMGFDLASEKNDRYEYVLNLNKFEKIPTQISIVRRAYGTS